MCVHVSLCTYMCVYMYERLDKGNIVKRNLKISYMFQSTQNTGNKSIVRSKNDVKAQVKDRCALKMEVKE